MRGLGGPATGGDVGIRFEEWIAAYPGASANPDREQVGTLPGYRGLFLMPAADALAYCLRGLLTPWEAWQKNEGQMSGVSPGVSRGTGAPSTRETM